MSDPVDEAVRKLAERLDNMSGWALCDSVERCELLLTEQLAPLLRAVQTLPLDSFGDDMSKCDAADFVDHAGEFFEAMVLARAAWAKLTGRTP